MPNGWMATGGNFEPALAVLIEARKAGQDFATAWPHAIQACDPAVRTILRETAKAWQEEFEGRRAWGCDLVAALAVIDHDAAPRHDNRIVA